MALDDIVMTEGSFATHEPDEWNPGTIVRVEEADDYGYGPTLRFVILLDGEEFETWALCSQKLTPRSKLYTWLNGVDPTLIPQVGKAVNLNPLTDRPVDVMFEQVDGKERVTKIRAQKARKTDLQTKQGQAAAAKKPVERSSATVANRDGYGPGEEPF